MLAQAFLNPGEYPTGQRVSDAEIAALNIEGHSIWPTIGVGTVIAGRPLHTDGRDVVKPVLEFVTEAVW